MLIWYLNGDSLKYVIQIHCTQMCGNKAKSRDTLSIFIFAVLYEHCNTFAPFWADSKNAIHLDIARKLHLIPYSSMCDWSTPRVWPLFLSMTFPSLPTKPICRCELCSLGLFLSWRLGGVYVVGLVFRLGGIAHLQASPIEQRDGTVDDPVVGLTKFPHKKNLFEETFGCMVRVWTLR